MTERLYVAVGSAGLLAAGWEGGRALQSPIVFTHPTGLRAFFHRGRTVDYWDREQPPGG